MENLTTWLGAGIVTAGVSAALLAGAGVANADTESGSDTSGGTAGTSTSDSPGSDAGTANSARDSPSTKPETKPETTPSTSDSEKPEKPEKPEPVEDEPKADEPEKEPKDQPAADTETATEVTTTKKKPVTIEPAVVATESVTAAPAEATVAESESESESAPESEPAPAPVALRRTESTVTPTAAAAADVTPPAPSLIGFVGSVIGSVVINVGSIALTALQAVEALVAGPPVLPPGSTVTVRDSWITLGNGQRVAANWYYPKGDTPPERMILLQHGLLALGPMYSYTAANLAERTGSIVVTPSITSNVFLGDDHWLGGIGMASEIADLFVDDRVALTRSALDAGFAQRYGLTPAEAELPEKFALVGHSLGGHLVSAAAGFLAENGAAEDLVGVISLDGVPLNDTMENALAKLDAYEIATGRYIPIREIGAPWNIFNAFSNINEALTAARPDHFNGVVLADGVHMDSMQGGNQLIQFAAYVAAGFPQPQNPPAVQELSVTWLEQWFGGDPFVGDDLEHGSSFDIVTPQGTAVATVIGDAGARLLGRSLAQPFAATPPTAIPAAGALPTALAV